MVDRLDRQVHVEIGPVQVLRGLQFHVKNLTDLRIAKPWELLEGQEQLAAIQEEPEAVL